jgi:hypothetical protein
VHVVDAFAREAGRDLDVVLLHVQDQRQEPLDVRRRDVVSVRTLDQRLHSHEHQGEVSGRSCNTYSFGTRAGPDVGGLAMEGSRRGGEEDSPCP